MLSEVNRILGSILAAVIVAQGLVPTLISLDGDTRTILSVVLTIVATGLAYYMKSGEPTSTDKSTG